MPALVAGIHDLRHLSTDVDGRDKPGHDVAGRVDHRPPRSVVHRAGVAASATLSFARPGKPSKTSPTTRPFIMDDAKLIGGSDADRKEILRLHEKYIDVNTRFDWEGLQPIYSPSPEATYFNLNGHTYQGPRALDPALEVLRPERRVDLLDAVRHRRRGRPAISPWCGAIARPGANGPARSRRRATSTTTAGIHLALDHGVPQGGRPVARGARAFLAGGFRPAAGRRLEAWRRCPRLSVRLHGGMTPQACVEQARAAEAAGIDGIWFAENPFARGILPAAAACALATTTQRIGAGVFNPFSRHPTLIAMEIGALDELSGGRVRLGIGSGLGHAVERMGFSTQALADHAARGDRDRARAAARRRGHLHAARCSTCRQVKLDYRAARRHPDLHGGARRQCAEGLRRDRRRPDRVQHVRGGLRREGGAQACTTRRAPPGRTAIARRWCSTCRAFRAPTATRRSAPPSARSPTCCRPTGRWRSGCPDAKAALLDGSGIVGGRVRRGGGAPQGRRGGRDGARRSLCDGVRDRRQRRRLPRAGRGLRGGRRHRAGADVLRPERRRRHGLYRPGIRGERKPSELLQLGHLDGVLPARALLGEELFDVGRRAADRLGADRTHLLDHLGLLQDRVGLDAELLDDRRAASWPAPTARSTSSPDSPSPPCRSAARRAAARPASAVETPMRDQRAGLDVRQDRAEIVDHHGRRGR